MLHELSFTNSVAFHCWSFKFAVPGLVQVKRSLFLQLRGRPMPVGPLQHAGGVPRLLLPMYERDHHGLHPMRPWRFDELLVDEFSVFADLSDWLLPRP
jgi:hypothetical protein